MRTVTSGSRRNLTEAFDKRPGDAFADHDEEQGSAQEVVNEQNQDAYAPAIARTGTDDFERTDPPFAGPGLDLATSASAPSDTNSETQGGLGDLTPAGWSSALEEARRDEPTLASPAKSEMGVNVAVLPLTFTVPVTNAPPAMRRVKLAVVSVELVIGSENVADTEVLTMIPVAPLAGEVADTIGGVVSGAAPVVNCQV